MPYYGQCRIYIINRRNPYSPQLYLVIHHMPTMKDNKGRDERAPDVPEISPMLVH